MLSTLTAANMPLDTIHTMPQFSEIYWEQLQQAPPLRSTPQLFNKRRKNFGLQSVDIFQNLDRVKAL